MVGSTQVDVPMCRIVGVANANADSRIGFEVWMPPASSWNGKFQAVTQVNEPTLVFIPKFAISFVVLLIAGPWMADQLLQFTTQMLTMLPAMAR
jgi:hypothetical protein